MSHKTDRRLDGEQARSSSKRVTTKSTSQPNLPSVEGARVDAAHAKREAVSESPRPESAVHELANEQLQLQASQLARHLQLEQRRLDQREAELNARTAKFESDVRNWRLVADEKRCGLDERERELQDRFDEIERQATALSAASLAVEGDLDEAHEMARRREEKLQQRGAAIREQEKELELGRRTLHDLQNRFDQQQLERESRRASSGGEELGLLEQQLQNRSEELGKEALRIEELQCKLVKQQAELSEKQGALSEQGADLREKGAQLVEREQRVGALEEKLREREQTIREEQLTGGEQLNAVAQQQRLLKEAADALDDQRAELERQRERSVEESVAAGNEVNRRLALIAEEQRAAEREFVARERELQQLSARLDQRFTTLEQVRSEVARMHQESLELRLAAEELWVGELSERIPPERLASDLSSIRQSIAERYQLEQLELDQRRAEIVTLVETLDKRRAVLEQQRDKVQAWAGRRQHEIEEQAARLVAREHELNSRERRLGEEEQQRAEQRLERDQQLRSLFRDLVGKQAA